MRLFAWLGLRRLASQRGRAALPVVGVAIATALFVASTGAINSLIGSARDLVALAGRAELEVRAIAMTGMPEDAFFEVEETPGVAAAVPAIRSDVVIDGAPSLLLGFDERAGVLDQSLMDIRATGADGRSDLNGVFLGEALARRLSAETGSTVEVFAAGATRSARVLEVLAGSGVSRINRGLFAAAALPVAQELAGKAGHLDAIYVITEDGTDTGAVDAALATAVAGRGAVVPIGDRVRAVSAQIDDFRQQLLVISGAVLVVAAFLILNTMAMVARERRRELATLRAVGVRPATLVRSFLLEATTLGFVGAVGGGVAGVLAGRAAVERLPTAMASRLGVVPTYHLEIPTLLFAVAVATALAALAAVLPARRASQVEPVEAMRPEGLDFDEASDSMRPRIALAGAAIAFTGLVLLSGVLGPGGVAGAGVVLVGLLVGTFGLVPAIVAAAKAVARRGGPMGALAATGLDRERRRTWATCMVIAVSAAMAITLTATTNNISTSIQRWFSPLRDVDLAVQSWALDELPGAATLPSTWAEELRAVPGIASVLEEHHLVARHRGTGVLIQGVTARSSAPLLRLAEERARSEVFAANAVIAARRFADVHGLSAGDQFEMSTAQGPVDIRVAAIVDHVSEIDGGVLLADAARVRSWFDFPGASRYELVLDEQADASVVAAALHRLVGASGLRAFVADGSQLYEAATAISRQFQAIFTAIAWVAVGAAALGLLNTFALALLERRRELGIFRAIGVTRRQLGRMILSEAGATAATGTMIGIAVGMVVHYGVMSSATEILGIPVPYEPDPVALLWALLAPLAVTVFGGLWPSRQAAREPITQVVAYE